jgi:hypothetical protein
MENGMPRRRFSPYILVAILLAGCADWQRGAYEGLRKREEIMTPPGLPERTAPPPDYDTYRKEKP